MNRRTFTTANAALFLSAATLGARTSLTNAQDATPSPDAIVLNEVAPGVTAEIFAAAPSAVAPGQTVYVARFVFQAGMEIFPHGHPGTTVLGVSSGSFGWTLVSGTAHVVRGAASASPGATEDLIEAGADVVLEPGDAIFYESDVIHTARGAGSEPAVVLASLVLETGAPLLMPADMDMGTPTSSPPDDLSRQNQNESPTLSGTRFRFRPSHESVH